MVTLISAKSVELRFSCQHRWNLKKKKTGPILTTNRKATLLEFFLLDKCVKESLLS